MEFSKPKVLIDLAEYEELTSLRDNQVESDEVTKLKWSLKIKALTLNQLLDYISPATIRSFNEDPTTEVNIVRIDDQYSISYKTND